MTLTQLRHIQICKKIFLAISAFILCGSTFGLVYSVEYGEILYNDKFIDYTKTDKTATLKAADFYFNKALEEKDADSRMNYLRKASGEYFILTQSDKNNLYPIVQLARVYDLEEENNYSKAYFHQALKIDKNNPSTNFYFGEYYYRRKDYPRALYFYKKASQNGFKENTDLQLKMGIIYEKLGDLLRANQYYKKAFLANPNDTETPDKIREIEAVKYKNTGYYNKYLESKNNKK